ncbi:uncharacterized protein LOC134183265 [Corticium candelabrum]|uniref:uncharacterized protein LOC134183265 n=1 Tax=Corticium candelabrum TaxID=121492 RepID=UPI002E26C2F1|nr:uncharacterized protein LOC134183265 [Corticium candelabrum]
MPVLNDGDLPARQACDGDVFAGSLSRKLQKLMLRMKGEHMSEDGRSVDYRALRKSEVFKEYQEKTLLLRTVDIRSLQENDRLAFYINVYNALGLHGLAIQDKPLNSVLEVDSFWSSTCYNIGGHVFSLDDLEHGILRGNRPHPATGRVCFQLNDPRCQFSVHVVDPRIHFALVCGAKSCPPIQVYSPDNLDRGLQAAARSFCEQEIDIDLPSKMVTFSKIFQWYGSDFGDSPREILLTCLPYLSTDKQHAAKQVIDDPEMTVNYKEYDWSLNEKFDGKL